MLKLTAAFIVWWLCLVPVTGAAQPLYSHRGPEVPQVPLWAEEANGDAIQKDLGFILPKKWKGFDRYQFSSTRADGGSVKTWYRSSDSELTLNILIQLRLDIRGIDLGSEVPWTLIKMASDVEFGLEAGKKPVELSSAPFSLGGRQPPGKVRWTRHDLASGPKVQGTWWQNIGIWSVVITAAGPEARKADVEKAGASVINEMPFPHAPAAAEFMAIGPKLFAAMPVCAKDLPEGNGLASSKSMEQAVKTSLIMPSFVMDNPKTAPISPVTSGTEYCKIESFKSSKGEVTAVRFTGKPGEFWDARYGFALNAGRNGYLQFDRNTALGPAPGSSVLLTYSDKRQVTAFALFSDWPSYAEAKKAVEGVFDKPPNVIARVSHPANKVLVQVDTDTAPPSGK
jgi:hypothetical protein